MSRFRPYPTTIPPMPCPSCESLRAQLAAQAETIDTLRGENERQITEHTAIRALNIRLASTLENREAELTAAKAENERLMGAARELNARLAALAEDGAAAAAAFKDNSTYHSGCGAGYKHAGRLLRELGLMPDAPVGKGEESR